MIDETPRRRQVLINCRDCGRLIGFVKAIPDSTPYGTTLQFDDIFESRLKDVICSECGRAARQLLNVRSGEGK